MNKVHAFITIITYNICNITNLTGAKNAPIKSVTHKPQESLQVYSKQ